MHVVFRESRGLEETATPRDIGQDSADLVVLSYSDSDLAAFAAGWRRGRSSLPSLRLANLAELRHPLSVDTYIERTLSQARGILVRLIGGESYWPYGLAALQQLAKDRNIVLAVLPADGRDDARLDAYSTLPVSTLRRLKVLCDTGGPVAAQAAIAQLALASGLYAGPVVGEMNLPEMGFYEPARGVIAAPMAGEGRPLALVTFYRSYLTAADTGPVDALIAALRERGFSAYGVFVTSLKAPGVADWLRAYFATNPPAAIVNATAFSAMGDDGTTPFDAASCPVFQVALSSARREDWAESLRGLSPGDLAMHVVLPEVDGRLFAGVVSFKSAAERDPDLQFSHLAHRPDEERVKAVAARAAAWRRLAETPAAGKRVALVLSNYPGRPHQIAHAVGLDALASVETLLSDLTEAGFDVAPVQALGETLLKQNLTWSVVDYRAALSRLPQALQDDLAQAWGAPEDDPGCRDGAFQFAAIASGRSVIAVQPERGDAATREADYHDLARTPRHAYVAFYLWLRGQAIDAVVHMGAHGTLEWLPGKSVALSSHCWPEALIGDLPVIYPFIVNDPGEAAQAKRRIGAVTIGHLPPPLEQSAVPEGLRRLERLLDEYSTADGLDPARRQRLIVAIRDEARTAGLEDDLGLDAAAAPAEAIPRIDRFVCDLKESQFGDGLHVFGRGACADAERDALRAALAGQRVAPGPSGSPYRGRQDVLPTGRNLFAVDPRAVPTPSAHAQGIKLAEELLRRHLQDHGDWPKGLVVDLWGSATMRTAGEEFAMALHLAGLAPRWDHASGRVTGYDIIAPAELARPRIDVTLRVSGLFRDVFSGLAQLFEAAAEALASREDEGDENPYRHRASRVFAPRPGQYGVGLSAIPDAFTAETRDAAGEAWLSASSWAFSADGAMQPDRAGIETRLASADAFVHVQDLPETDLLLAADYAAHEAGIAAAAAHLGAAGPSLYHLDTTRPEQPHARTLTEEISRVVRARAANPAWIAGVMRHGFRGAAEITATLEHMAAFAHLAGAVPPHLFDLYYDATLGDTDVRSFMVRENPAALAAIETCFMRLHEASLWRTRRNSIAAALKEAS
ncbi:cobaltochelatase subunit CobN [Bradyrhizobium japonicum]|uniref:cobaltochelatase subunit CobN n=1 Tax=Bradyrhizobium japonicum TaxID=375 RepID=UPI0004569B2C|nr:cobaltochelatase subunit CobN [Bradyrhizobium japonicum]AHY51811.1 cobalamin biosynthesis protein [Bradyrhizobium japonicum SEMIA 5079]MCD9105797.1 cobaltochelatase subunit CobN [Bradyrhizobium japonicum]MCD9253357.1 cobaltochelatase subunit CobN [Bradyrhizobium japonicum SEMIA 5079]MCD9818442.1 cobaltochelatase subunit CobN [Bradyrhizobium japonicum]MCD9891423.1 cobaltochelatase subunit CobN [Bradyrhizobium japonicum]